jgi:hypothetical protein
VAALLPGLGPYVEQLGTPDDYCSDKLNGLNHVSGKVFAHFEKHNYTVADLEATNLWQRLEAEAQAQGKC